MTLRETVRTQTVGVIAGILAAVLLAIAAGVAFKARSDYRAAGVAHERAEETRRVVLSILGVEPGKETPEILAARGVEANKILAMLSAPAVFQGRALSVEVGEGKTRAVTVGELVGVVAQERAAMVLQGQTANPAPAPGGRK